VRPPRSGLLDGVTTNPTLVAATGDRCARCSPRSVTSSTARSRGEVLSTTYDEMIEEAHELAAIAPNIVVKIPLIADGLRVGQGADREGIRTNVTLCFSPIQAMLAAKAGATYISPFVGRLDDVGHDGMDTVAQIVEIYNNYEFDTEVLVASVRSPTHVLEALRLGADVVHDPAEGHPSADQAPADRRRPQALRRGRGQDPEGKR
jgi:transaldolase